MDRHRRSIRRDGYDYSAEGAYFVTICVQEHRCLLGEIANDEVRLNDAGRMVCHWFYELENKYPELECDELICMPNHLHFIVINWGNDDSSVGADLRVRPDRGYGIPTVGADLCVRPDLGYGSGSEEGGHTGPPLQSVVQWFKTMTTNAYIRGVKESGWPRFNRRLWQRNYYEHIIRSESSHDCIRTYIRENPEHWRDDDLTPWDPEM